MRAFLSQQELLRPERKRKTIAAETLAASLHRLLCKADGLPSSMSWNLISRPHLSLSLSLSLSPSLSRPTSLQVVFAQLAHRLGVWLFKTELEDLPSPQFKVVGRMGAVRFVEPLSRSFKYLYPTASRFNGPALAGLASRKREGVN